MPDTLVQNPKAVSVGPGLLYIAAIGSAEPTTGSSAWDAAFIPLGLTTAGHTFTTEGAFGDVDAAELLDPVLVAETGRTITVAFNLLEITAKHLQAAHNGGNVTTNSGYVKFEPPVLGQATPVMLGWDALDNSERILWRKCLATGSIALARAKAPAATNIPVSYRVLPPDDGTSAPFSHWLAAATRA